MHQEEARDRANEQEELSVSAAAEDRPAPVKKSREVLKEELKERLSELSVPPLVKAAAESGPSPVMTLRMKVHGMSIDENKKRKQEDVVNKILVEIEGGKYKEQGIWDSTKEELGPKALPYKMLRFQADSTIIGALAKAGSPLEFVTPDDIEVSAATKEMIFKAYGELARDAYKAGIPPKERRVMMREAMREVIFGK